MNKTVNSSEDYKDYKPYEEYELPNLELPENDQEESLADFFKGISPALSQFEIERKRVFKVHLILWSLWVIVLIPSLVYLSMASHPILGIGLGALSAMLVYSYHKPYLKQFKKDIIQIIFGRMGVYVNHDAFDLADSKRFVKSGLFKKTNEYKGEDLIVGKRGNLHFSASEFIGNKVTGSGKSRRSKLIFEGIFFHAELPNIFDTETIIACRDFRFEYNHKLEEGDFDVLHPDFHRLFKVIYTNYNETSHILSMEFMDRLVAFKKMHHHPFMIKIKGDNLYLAIKENKDFFRYRITYPAEDFIRFKLLYADCKFLADLVKSLEALCE